MMVEKISEMLNGVWRIKWWKYRYVLFVALVVNLLLINHFFSEQPFTSLNPFRSSASEIQAEPPPSPPPPPPPESASSFNLHDYDFNGQYVGWPLERVCKETTWTPGLIFVCDNNSGGIGNIRNFILTCIRYAIDAGASGITMPRIQRRSEEDLANIFTTGFQPFDYFFNEEHFRKVMNTYCPQMTILNLTDDATTINGADITRVEEFYPKDLGDLDGCDGRGVNRHLDMFRTKFDNWLITRKHMPTEQAPMTIRFKWATFFEWPIYRDGPEFAATFGDILRINADIEDLSKKVLMQMTKFVGAPPDPEKLEAPYLGVHLRTESDALGFWPDFNVQSEGYLKEAELRGLKHAYLATGNATDGHRFAEKASEKLKMKVTSKLDLLQGEDLQRLTDLSWDQQALVDFLVLTKSTHFTGCSFSSFTMNIAFKRHLMTDGLNTRPWKSPGDAYSTLVGRFEMWYGDWMFMYESLGGCLGFLWDRIPVLCRNREVFRKESKLQDLVVPQPKWSDLKSDLCRPTFESPVAIYARNPRLSSENRAAVFMDKLGASE